MNDTPETNEAQFWTGRVSVDFARRLETERDEAREIAAWWRDNWKKGRTMSMIASTELPWENVKEHAPLSARASVYHGVGVESTGEHVNRAADRGCCVSTC